MYLTDSIGLSRDACSISRCPSSYWSKWLPCKRTWLLALRQRTHFQKSSFRIQVCTWYYILHNFASKTNGLIKYIDGRTWFLMSCCKPNKNGSVHSEVKNSWKVTSVIKKHCPPGWYYNTFPQTFPTGVGGQTCACARTEAQPAGMVTLGLVPVPPPSAVKKRWAVAVEVMVCK